ncbi:MAG: SUMF1/EgtB/PvdO family nonheme iron enzyme, partial [Pseudomonadota bacterium]
MRALTLILLGTAGSAALFLSAPASAQDGDPYVSAIDDRPAARLERMRERRAKGLPDMVTIQPGFFMMGSPHAEEKRDRNEGPQVPVTINYSFEIGQHEVTFD